MFDIGWSEMAVILLVALVVIGPKDLPQVARTVGRWAAKGRAMAREFQTALEDMAREAELDKVKNEIEKAGRTNVGKAIEKTIDPSGELSKAFDPTASSSKKTGGDKPNGEQARLAPSEPASPAPAPASQSNASPRGGEGKSSPPEAPSPKSTPAQAAPADASGATGVPSKSSPGKPRARTPRAKPKTPARETAPAEPS